MNVTSPVGDFPYTLDRVELRGGSMRVHGHMGTWPSQIEVVPADAVQVLRTFARPLLLLAAVTLLAARLARALR